MHGMSCHWSSALTVRSAEKLVAFTPLIFTCSSTCFTYSPLAISCAPFLHMARSSRSPLLSMNVTSLRSIMQARLSSLLCALFQAVLNSLTHGPTKRPCTIHLLSVAVSMMVILSMLIRRLVAHSTEIRSGATSALVKCKSSSNFSSFAISRFGSSVLWCRASHWFDEPNRLIANELKFELDLHLTSAE